MLLVSIHAPVKVRQKDITNNFSYRSFNSRTREGATVSFTNLQEKIIVSIHAPVKVRQIQ